MDSHKTKLIPTCTEKMKHADNDLKLTEKIIEKLTCPVSSVFVTRFPDRLSNNAAMVISYVLDVSKSVYVAPYAAKKEETFVLFQ